jgi:hypothetical protein
MLVPASLLLSAGAAAAQANNGGGSSIGPCTPTSNTTNLGSFNVGASFKAHLVPICLFDVGAAVAVTVNGQSVGTKTADAGGGVTASITITSATQLSVDDPVVVPAQCGDNNVTARGPSAAAEAPVTVTGVFNVVCAGAPPGSVVSKGGLPFTGADIARLAAVALALVIVGFVIVRVMRRRRDSEAAV